MITRLPVDLIFDILFRLPAKKLLQLKIICKSWYIIISDNYFVNCHLERSLSTNTNHHFLVTSPQFYLQKYAHLPKPHRQSCTVLNSADFETLDNPYELSHPFKVCKTGVWVLGTCRGLVLLRVGSDILLLYNPTTQTYNVLPHLYAWRSTSAYCHTDYGIGYDSVSKDYKCVRIVQFSYKLEVLMCQVMVYSLRSNCWKRVDVAPCHFRVYHGNVCALVHEAFHWVGTDSDGAFEVIVAFSLRDEKFSCLPLPDFQFDQTTDELYTGELDGCLCLLVNRYPYCNVWVMKEYGVARSWTRMYSFEKLQCTNLERPVTYSMDRKKLFFTKSLNELGCIDLETKEHVDITFADWERGLNAYVYVENLLMLDYAEFADDIRSGKEQHGKRKKKNRRRRRRNNQ